MVNCIIYTANIGNKDWMNGVPKNGFKYVCFCDEEPEYHPTVIDDMKNWEIRKIRRNFSSMLTARMCKVLAHQFLPEAEITIWIDCNMVFLKDPNEVLDLLGNLNMSVYENLNFKSQSDEVNALNGRKGVDIEVMRMQLEKYINLGFPKYDLVATGFLVRRNIKEIEIFNNFWWSELCRHSHRDQMGFRYCAWKLGTHFYRIPWLSISGPIVAHKRIDD